MAYVEKAEIYPEPDGKFAFDNGRIIRICFNPDDVGAQLEPMLWPLVEKPLKSRKHFTITIEYGTD